MDNLITIYQQRLNLPGALFSRIDHDDAMVAMAYKIMQTDGVQLILKICSSQHDYLREVYFLKFFADKLPVPRLIQVVQPGPGIFGAVLMEYLQGTLLTLSDFNGKIAFEMGSLLARIHVNRVTGYGDLTQPQNLAEDPSVPFRLKFLEGLDECKDHLPKSLIDQCRRYFDSNIHLLDFVDGPCVIHRDFRAGNVIVHNGKIQGIIDWSSGRAGFAEDDFCPLEHDEWPSEPLTREAFLSGYESVRPVPNYKALMPLLRLNRAIAVVGFTVKRGTWQSAQMKIYQSNRRFLETFF